MYITNDIIKKIFILYHIIKVKGKPSTGKTFLIHTLKNLTRNCLKSNSCDEATALTGYAASLIDGKTHDRSLLTSVAKNKFHGTTTNIVINNTAHRNIGMIIGIKCLFKIDEEIMAGCTFWAWFKHRLEEARSDDSIFNENLYNSIHHKRSRTYFHGNVYNRTYEGLSIVYSFGDYHQLPPVGMRVISDIYNVIKINTSYFQGFFTFDEFSIQLKMELGTVLS